MTTIQSEFFNLLDERKFDECESLLNRERANAPSPGVRRFLDYCAAILHFETHRWDEAERTLLRLLAQPLHPNLQARVLNELGIVTEHLGRFGRAIESYEHALELLASGDDPVYHAKVLKNTAICYLRAYEMGQVGPDYVRRARVFIRQAIGIFQAHNQRLLEGRGWNELGASYKAVGEWAKAIECYQIDRQICLELEDRHGLAASLNNIGEALAASGEYAQAYSLLKESVQLFQAERDLYQQADALTNLGRTLAAQGQLDEATQSFDAAIDCVEAMRQLLTAHEARSDFFGTQTHIYGARLQHALAQQDAVAAFNTAERARARGLLELIANAPVQAPRQVPEELLTQEQELRQRLLVSLEQAPGELPEIERQLSDLYRRIQLFSPAFAAFKHVAPLSANEVLERLGASSGTATALLSYFAAGDEIVGFCLSPQTGVHAVRIPISAAQLAAASFDSFGRVRLSACLAGPSPELPPVCRPGRQPWLLERLYTRLIAPLLPHCPEHSNLVIVPHGPLHLLPLHATRDPETGEHLIERFDVTYAPSATVFLEHVQSQEPAAGRQGCLAVAYRSAAGRDLGQTEREAEAIVRLMGGRALIGPNARPHAVLEQARSYRYLHVAGHGRFSSAAPLASGLELSGGTLTAWDLLQAPDLGLELITLSACDTALNVVQPGDELLGLVRALLYTGAPSIVLSLWKIEDLSARFFMQTFYQRLIEDRESHLSQVLASTVERFRRLTVEQVRDVLAQDGLPPEEQDALLARLPRARETQHLIPVQTNAVCPFDHPYFWAPFVLVGRAWESIPRLEPEAR